MNQPQLPKTDSIEELARFWDTHDLTDFDDQVEEVPNPFRHRGTTVTVTLKPNEAQAVHQLAESNGIADAEMIRQWVLERIRTS